MLEKKHIYFIAILILVLIIPTASLDIQLERDTSNPNSQPSIMHPTTETLQKWLQTYNPAAPHAINNPKAESPTGTLSLLSHLDYIPAERDQGQCGNCWVWAGTGLLEIALDVNEGLFDRLSVQYFNSKYNGGTGPDWAGAGGWLEDFANFYENEGFTVPWSNTNAAWADMYQTAEMGTSVPWQTISTTPNYTITTCNIQTIQTFTVGQSTAISNIKNVLAQGKAIWFGFFLPTTADWNQFFSFWNYQSESVIWNPDYSQGHIWDSGGGGHAVLCVGYNDQDPENAYWIMVNSWGTTSGRPNGIFHLDMDMAYDCYFYDGPWGYYSFYWQTLDIAYSTESSAYVVNLESEENSTATTNLGTITFDSISYSLPNNASKTAGNYSIQYTANDGYTFDHWETSGGITVANATSSLTSISVSEDGTLKAVYKAAPYEPPALSSINSRLLNAAQNSTYFLYADPARMVAVAAYDVASGGILYGLCENPQNQVFDSNSLYVEQEGLEKGKLLTNNKTVVFFGGPCGHWCVSYYENAGLTPAKYYYNASSNRCSFITQSGEHLGSLPATTNFTGQDMFVINVFKDNSNNTIYIFYGITWKGTWAAGIYFHGVLNGQIDTLTGNSYVYHWTDLSGDGVPQPSEIHREYP